MKRCKEPLNGGSLRDRRVLQNLLFLFLHRSYTQIKAETNRMPLPDQSMSFNLLKFPLQYTAQGKEFPRRIPHTKIQ